MEVRQIDETMQSYVDGQEMAGGALFVRRGGEVLYREKWGNVEFDSIYRMMSMNRSGDGTITVNGTVGEISLQNDPNDKVPEDTKKANVMINGTCTANIPLFIMRHDTTVTTHIPLDVRIHETAPRSVVNFEAGSGNSTITTFVEFTFNNNSGQEIAVKDTGK